jgi:hypothetical protein
VVVGNPGDLIVNPREQWHTFWNAGDAPARVLEIISPAGFEDYFRELGAQLISGPLIRNGSRHSARTKRSTWTGVAFPALSNAWGFAFREDRRRRRIDFAFMSVDMPLSLKAIATTPDQNLSC